MRKRELLERIEEQAREIADLRWRVGMVEARPIVPVTVPWVVPYYPRLYWREETLWCDGTISVVSTEILGGDPGANCDYAYDDPTIQWTYTIN